MPVRNEGRPRRSGKDRRSGVDTRSKIEKKATGERRSGNDEERDMAAQPLQQAFRASYHFTFYDPVRHQHLELLSPP